MLRVPTATSPKLTLVGMTESCAWSPAPFSAIIVGEWGSLLTTDRLPVALPAA